MSLPIQAVAAVLRWSPVWIPAILVWLIHDRGLEPAQAERERLAQARPEVVARFKRSESELVRMSTELAAWEDETYRERRRRAAR